MTLSLSSEQLLPVDEQAQRDRETRSAGSHPTVGRAAGKKKVYPSIYPTHVVARLSHYDDQKEEAHLLLTQCPRLQTRFDPSSFFITPFLNHLLDVNRISLHIQLNSDAKPCKTKEPKGLSSSITTDLFKVIGESINKGT